MGMFMKGGGFELGTTCQGGYPGRPEGNSNWGLGWVRTWSGFRLGRGTIVLGFLCFGTGAGACWRSLLGRGTVGQRMLGYPEKSSGLGTSGS